MNRRDDVWQFSFCLFSYLHSPFYSHVDYCIDMTFENLLASR
jgi:hypothetical protein